MQKNWIAEGYIKKTNSLMNYFRGAWKGGMGVLFLMAAVLSGIIGMNMKTGLGTWADFAISAGIGTAAVTIGVLGLWLVVYFIRKLPSLFAAVFITGLIVLILLFKSLLGSAPVFIVVGLALGLIILEILFGISLWTVIRRGIRSPITVIVLTLTLSANIFAAVWVRSSGTEDNRVKECISLNSERNLEKLDIQNPGEPGLYEVGMFTYGSGKDKHRKEYGENVNVVTSGVNASPFLENYNGLKAKLRTAYWGFDSTNMPVDGRVWYPVGDGPFPLVLIVHGNHNMTDFSDPGYAYLGKLLASQGYITVSVDENFLNGGWMGDLGNENDARAWILLKHLDEWDKFNQTPQNPLYSKVDFNNIALIGHSRGGEAAVAAAMFNKMKFSPDCGTLQFNFNYNIKSVIAIAPSFAQYQAADRSTRLENIDYFVIQGANDQDVSMFMGRNQYRNVFFDDGKYHFKSSLYIYNANHGQFNTVWGRKDYPDPIGWFLNTKPLMDGEEQRQIANVYISAFLKVTLKGDDRYIPMFENYRYAEVWLPNTIYINRFEDSNFKAISNYEEDTDIATTTLNQGSDRGNGFTVWKEEAFKFRRNYNSNNNVVHMKWENNSNPNYRIILPDDIVGKWRVNSESYLVFSAADADESKLKDESPTEMNVEVRLIDSSGESSTVELKDYGMIYPPVGVQLTKWDFQGRKFYGKEYEPQLQTFRLKLEEFIKSNPKFNPEKIKTIYFDFGKNPKGEIIMDDIGIE